MAKKSSSSNSAASISLQLQRLSNEATEKSFQYNTQEANTARTWQKEMSDTSHQREVQDLIKAGLNPVLSSGGNGAQSYTTSSASAQAENAANAVGNVWSSDISARATRAAAATSAAATRYAAAQQAAAARYSASLAYQAKIEGYKNNLEVAEKQGKWSYKTAIDKPVSSIGGAIDKFANKAGLYDLLGTNTVKNAVNNAKKLFDNPMQYFKDNVNGTKVSIDNFKLNTAGKNLVNNSLNKLGITSTSSSRKLFIQAFVFGNQAATNQLYKLVPKKKNQNSGFKLIR